MTEVDIAAALQSLLWIGGGVHGRDAHWSADKEGLPKESTKAKLQAPDRRTGRLRR
jgi:hypothetical protein